MKAVKMTLIPVSIAFLFLTLAQSQPPAAPVRDVVDEHWGVTVHDPYRYMENLDDPQVQRWFQAQADYTQTVLSQIQGRNALLERLKQLDSGKPFRIYSIIRRADGSMFYKKRMAGENLPKLYFRHQDGSEILLVDPEAVEGPDGQHVSLEAYKPSPGGRHVVYGLALGGSEETTLHIVNVETGEQLPETIDRIETAYNSPNWLPDGSGFTYARRQQLPPDAPATEIYKNTKTYLHQLGADLEDDKVVFGRGASKGVKLLDVDFPSIYIPTGSDYAIGKIKHGDNNEITLYTTLIRNLTQAKIAWKKICDASDEVEDYAVFGETIYLLTARDAPRYKVVKTSLARPNFARAEIVLPESDMVILKVSSTEDALYADVLDGGFNRILRLEHGSSGPAGTLALPNDAAGFVTTASPDMKGILVYTSNWTKGSLIYAYDPDSKEYTDTGLLPQGAFDDVPGYVSREVHVESHDGVMVPLSILHKKGLRLDGTHPTLLTGYGSYGSTSGAFFSATRLAWLELGGVYAIAHVRGGGAYGKEWHLAGRMLNKPNTWKDFIACAEYLIEKRYTSRGRLAGQGGSAGGITIGRAITERPDLFTAAIINNGLLDAVRAETTTNGVPNIKEFGTVTEKDAFRGLHAMSAYHHVKNGTAYPAVILTHGFNDPRVDPWMSAKMTARLLAATSSDRPVLFRVDYDAGHGIGSTRDQYLVQLADTWAFLLWQFRVEGFK